MSSILREEASKLLPSLKEELKDEATGVDDEHLIKFLLWKQDVNRAAERFRTFQKWRNENEWSHVNLELSKDEQLKKHVSDNVIICPGTIKTRNGCTVLVGRLRFNDMSNRTPQEVARMMLYIIDRALELQSSQEKGIIIFHDLKGLTKKNLHPGVAKLVLRAILGHFPLKISGIYILNAPFFFKPLFQMISGLLFSKKLKERVHYLNKVEELYDVVDQHLLLEEHGGTLKFDINDWIENQIQREHNGELTSILL